MTAGTTVSTIDSGVRLPIEIVPGTNPPVFVWKQLVDTPAGRQVVNHRGSLPPTIELAVTRLVGVAKQLLMDNATLRGTIQGLNERIEAQAEVKASGTKRGK